MRDVAIAAGASVVFAYLLGSIPVGYLLGRRSLRHGLRRLERGGRALDDELRHILAGSDDSIGVVVLDTAKVLLAATIAWHVVIAVSPGGTATRPNQSAIAFLADQVLVSWQSVGLWAGLAAVVGHLAPPWLAFRGDGGQAPGLALAVVYAPIPFVAGVVTFLAARLIFGPDRLASAVLSSLGTFVATAWMCWVLDIQVAWGVPAGPETTLWATVLAGVIAARTL